MLDQIHSGYENELNWAPPNGALAQLISDLESFN